jgi:uncharacterized protein
VDLGLSLTILALGFVGSIISGLLGVGGAAVIIPLLLYVPPLLGLGSLDIKEATAIAVTHVFFSTSSGALAHARYQQVDRGLAISSSIGTVLGALVGGVASKFVTGQLLFTVFAATVTAGAAIMLLPAPPSALHDADGKLKFSSPLAALIGAAVGLLIGLLGAGAFMLVPLMRYALRVPMKLAIGTGLVVAAVSAAGGFAAKLATGQIPLLLAAAVTLGALPGAQLGSWLGIRLSGGVLRRLYALLITSIAVGLWFDLLHF